MCRLSKALGIIICPVCNKETQIHYDNISLDSYIEKYGKEYPFLFHLHDTNVLTGYMVRDPLVGVSDMHFAGMIEDFL